jgi:hypothetical protein
MLGADSHLRYLPQPSINALLVRCTWIIIVRRAYSKAQLGLFCVFGIARCALDNKLLRDWFLIECCLVLFYTLHYDLWTKLKGHLLKKNTFNTNVNCFISFKWVTFKLLHIKATNFIIFNNNITVYFEIKVIFW